MTEIFRDDWERKAHDIICIVKYGGIGGQVRTQEMRRVADILRGHTLRPVVPPPVIVKPPVPLAVLPPPVVCNKQAVRVPAAVPFIRLP